MEAGIHSAKASDSDPHHIAQSAFSAGNYSEATLEERAERGAAAAVQADAYVNLVHFRERLHSCTSKSKPKAFPEYLSNVAAERPDGHLSRQGCDAESEVSRPLAVVGIVVFES
jgi:hypothetical protein